MANDEHTAVDPVSDALANRDSSPSIAARPQASLRPSQPPPIPRRTPTGTPAIPVAPGAKEIDPAAALPRGSTMMGLPRAQTGAPIPSILRPSTVPMGRAPTATMMGLPAVSTGSPVIARAPTEPVVGRAPTAQTMMGIEPVVARAPTQSGSQPVVGRASTATMMGLPSVSQPVVARVSTGRDVNPLANTALALPAFEAAAVGRAQTRSDTTSATRARGTTVIPVPPIAIPVAPPGPTTTAAKAPAMSITSGSSPIETVVPDASVPLAPAGEIAAPTALPAPLQITSFSDPSSPSIAVPASASSVADASTKHSAPANVTVSFSGLPPAIAAAIAAAPPSARPIGPQISLPPYVPAPNVGDPGEVIETVRVEKYELTELVERYAPLSVEHVSEIDEVPRAFDLRNAGKAAVRLAPLIGGVALVLTFAIGYLIFDRGAQRTTGKAAEPVAATISHDAVTATANDPSKATNDEAKLAAPKTDDANLAVAPNTDDANAAKADAAKDTVVDATTVKSDAPAPRTVATADANPVAKPLRGKIYINSNKPAQIFLDGKSASATTPRQLTVRPGMHKVTLWDTASGKTQTQMIEVQADKVVTVSKKF